MEDLSWGRIVHTLVSLLGVRRGLVTRSRESGRQFVQVHDGRRIARLQPQRLAVSSRRLLVFSVQVKNRAEICVTSRLVRPQGSRVPVPHLRVLQPVRLAQRGRCRHRQLVIGSGKFGGAELLLCRLR